MDKMMSQLATLTNAHANLNSQWDEMDQSGVEFHVLRKIWVFGELLELQDITCLQEELR